ncbi:uncharacterized protein [Rutidosis leptorrhynchoides]|uniref:uncharacterized protein n=1 Tax=Rutidosis leptorrhynchoides TaxID=125765 RepID=UPI003A993683
MLQQNREEILRATEENTNRIIDTRIQRETGDDNVPPPPEQPENPEHPENPERPEVLERKENGFRYKEFTETKPTIYHGKGGPIVEMDCLHWWNRERAAYGITEAAEIPWKKFKEMMKEKYCPRSETLKLEIEFLRLEMGNDTVQVYTEKFIEKSRFSPFHVANEARKIELYTEGLRPDLKRIVQVTMPKTFLEAVEAAKIADKDHEKLPQNHNNQKRRYNDFNSAVNKGRFAPPSNKRFNAPRTCNTCGKSHSGICRFEKRCSNCNKVGHIAQDCRIVEQTCYHCGKIGHIRPNCPDLGRGVAGTSKTEKKEVPKAKIRAFQMTKKEAKDTPDVVSGTFLVNNANAQVLFDSGANRSFVSTTFCNNLDRCVEKLNDIYTVEIADGNHVRVEDIINNCTITLGKTQFPITLVPIQLGEFDIVVGMDWLSENQAKIICDRKMIRIKAPNHENICIYGDKRDKELNLISMMKTRKYLTKGYEAYIAYVIDIKKENLNEIEDVAIVSEYPDVFPNELPGIPPKRQVEFKIDLVPGATPIARSPYHLAPTELQELMKQLQELLDKGFIRPINQDGIKVDPAKIDAVMKWEPPKTPKEVRSFIGLAGYYRRFIHDFSKIATPLTKLKRKNSKFDWGPEQEESFLTLRQKLSSAPILTLPEGTYEFVVYSDVSNLGLGCVLMQ